MHSQCRPTFQLTNHAIGSKREFWTLAWPLMLGLISSTLMLFVDRLFLARLSPMALNAAATGGIAYYVFLVVPMGIAAIAEVLVGRLHGEGSYKEVGNAGWQMVWFSWLLTPLFWAIGSFLPPILFAGTGNEVYETAYFETLMYFAPIQCATIAIGGFFIGIGQVKQVTISAFIGNGVNILLDYILIFGWGPIEPHGVQGAAIATGCALLAQMTFLLCRFWTTNNRTVYNTSNLKLDFNYLKEGLSIGTPSGLGHCFEVISHFIFFRIVLSVGPEQMSIVAMVQSLYILTSFVLEAGSKVASTLVANLLGAGETAPIANVLKSACTLHVLYFLLLFSIVIFFPEPLFHLFAPGEHNALMLNPLIKETFFWSLFFMSLFFLMDGFGWILIGFLTAAGDTRFVLLVSLGVHWVVYVAPTFWFIGIQKGGADVAWAIVAFMSLVNLLFYVFRYRSGLWLQSFTLKATT